MGEVNGVQGASCFFVLLGVPTSQRPAPTLWLIVVYCLTPPRKRIRSSRRSLRSRLRVSSHDDVVDRDENKLDEETNETHDREPDNSLQADLLVLCAVEGGGESCQRKRRKRPKRARTGEAGGVVWCSGVCGGGGPPRSGPPPTTALAIIDPFRASGWDLPRVWGCPEGPAEASRSRSPPTPPDHQHFTGRPPHLHAWVPNVPLASGLVHLFTSLNEFLAKSLSGFVKVSDRSMLGLLLLNHPWSLSSAVVADRRLQCPPRPAWPSLFFFIFLVCEIKFRIAAC